MIYIIETFEFNILKNFFIIPYYPVFKPSNLRKDFDFALYLELSLTIIMKSFIRVRLQCWVLIVATLLFWNVYISNLATHTKVNNQFIQTISLFLSPLYTVLLTFLSNIHLKNMYRKVVPELTHSNYLEIVEIEEFRIINTKTMSTYVPLYFEEFVKTECQQNRSKWNTFWDKIYCSNYNSAYESLVSGIFGLDSILAMLQFKIILFTMWICLILFKESIILFEGRFYVHLMFFVSIVVVYSYLLIKINSSNLTFISILSKVV